MSEFFDFYTIVFLALAVGIFLRLRSVLGRRTGHERPPFDPYSARRDKPANDDAAAPTAKAGDDGNVVTLPSRGKTQAKPAGPVPDWTAYVKPNSQAIDGLTAIHTAEPSFDPGHFLTGARAAYEMIVNAFAAGDRKTLRSLLSREVYDGFAAAIAERESKGEEMSTTFVGIDDATIVDAAVKGSSGQVTVRIMSKLITVTRDKDGKVVDGDPDNIADVTDVWTFARDLGLRDPNWNLIATEAGE